MPIGSKTGGGVNYIKNREAMCLTQQQANNVYKKVEESGIINMNTLQKELKQEIGKKDDNSYKKVVLNKVYREENKSPQIEDWSIFTDQIKYIQHNERTKHRIDFKDYRLLTKQ